MVFIKIYFTKVFIVEGSVIKESIIELEFIVKKFIIVEMFIMVLVVEYFEDFINLKFKGFSSFNIIIKVDYKIRVIIPSKNFKIDSYL